MIEAEQDPTEAHHNILRSSVAVIIVVMTSYKKSEEH